MDKKLHLPGFLSSIGVLLCFGGLSITAVLTQQLDLRGADYPRSKTDGNPVRPEY